MIRSEYFFKNRLNQFTHAFGCPQPAMVFDAENNILAGHFDNLSYFIDVECIGMLRSRRKADRRLQNPAGLFDFFKKPESWLGI